MDRETVVRFMQTPSLSWWTGRNETLKKVGELILSFIKGDLVLLFTVNHLDT